MGPYYRATAQSTGAFFDSFYEHPILMVLVVVGIIAGGIYFYRNKSKG